MEQLSKTLAEQMELTNHELDKRKELLGLTKQDEDILYSKRTLFATHLDEIVKEFYDKQTAFPEISLVIGDAETLRRLKSAMRCYILELFDGIYDLEYVNRRLRIGKVHQRIGVSPKLYISAIRLLEDVLQDTLHVHAKSDPDEVQTRLKKAINKILMLDTQLVFDTYIASLVAEVDTTRQQLREYADTLERTVAERTAQLEELSNKDSLTGLYNQRAFYDNLRREVSAAERFHESLSLTYFDLNNFKKINDKQGHVTGNEILVSVGQCLLSSLREIDIPCRYGGDEFAIIMPRTDKQAARKVVKRMIDSFKGMDKSRVSFSVGITSTVVDHFVDVESLVRDADRKMYKAKARARKKSGFYVED